MNKNVEEMMNEILKRADEKEKRNEFASADKELTFAEMIERNLPNINNEEIEKEISKIGYEDTPEQTEEKVIEETPVEEVILEDINEQEGIIDGEVEENENSLEIPKNIEYAEENEVPLEEGIDINEYVDIYSNSDHEEKDGTITYSNKKKLSSLAKRGIAIIAAIGVITGSVLVLKSCGKKNKNTTTVQPTTTVSSTEPTTTVPTTNDELDVEIEVNTKSVPTEKGEIDSKDVVIDNNGTAWESKEDASKAPKNGNKEVEVESGYLAPDGNVYESKEDYEKLINTKKTTKKTEKKLYYATDGTAFESEKDRDAWNAALKQQNSTTKKYYKANDGTLFESEKDRDAYNAAIKTENSTTKKYYEANDGTLFETKEDMEAWNKALQEQSAVQQNSYNSRQAEISLLKQYKEALVTSNLTYEETTIRTLSL